MANDLVSTKEGKENREWETVNLEIGKYNETPIDNPSVKS